MEESLIGQLENCSLSGQHGMTYWAYLDQFQTELCQIGHAAHIQITLAASDQTQPGRGSTEWAEII